MAACGAPMQKKRSVASCIKEANVSGKKQKTKDENKTSGLENLDYMLCSSATCPVSSSFTLSSSLYTPLFSVHSSSAFLFSPCPSSKPLPQRKITDDTFEEKANDSDCNGDVLDGETKHANYSVHTEHKDTKMDATGAPDCNSNYAEENQLDRKGLPRPQFSAKGRNSQKNFLSFLKIMLNSFTVVGCSVIFVTTVATNTTNLSLLFKTLLPLCGILLCFFAAKFINKEKQSKAKRNPDAKETEQETKKGENEEENQVRKNITTNTSSSDINGRHTTNVSRITEEEEKKNDKEKEEQIYGIENEISKHDLTKSEKKSTTNVEAKEKDQINPPTTTLEKDFVCHTEQLQNDEKKEEEKEQHPTYDVKEEEKRSTDVAATVTTSHEEEDEEKKVKKDENMCIDKGKEAATDANNAEEKQEEKTKDWDALDALNLLKNKKHHKELETLFYKLVALRQIFQLKCDKQHQIQIIQKLAEA